MALTVTDNIEITGSPNIEIARLSSTASGDSYSTKFKKIKTFLIQNHGATFATGVRDNPKVVVTQGTSTANAKIAITHTTTTEVFSVFIFGGDF